MSEDADRRFEHHEGGESEPRYMTTLLLNCTEAIVPILADDETGLNEQDAFALDILKEVLSKLDDDIALGEPREAAFTLDEENIEEKVPVLAGSPDQNRRRPTSQNMANYIDGQSRIRLEFDKEKELAVLTIYIDLVSNLGEMPLPEGTPTNISLTIMGNFTDDFYKKIPTDIGLPGLFISYYIHYQGAQPMYNNILHINIAPPTMPVETVEERMKKPTVYRYNPDLIEGILKGKDIVTQAKGEALSGPIHKVAKIQNLGKVYIPTVGRSSVFLENDNKSTREVDS